MRRHLTITPLARIEPGTSPLQGFVTREQLAAEYKVAPSTIRMWQLRDGMPYTRVGTQPVYKLADVEAWHVARPQRMHGGVRGSWKARY